MPAEGLSPDRYISGKTIHDYLYNFAKDHDLVRRVRLGTEVSSIENMASGSWRLDIAGDKPIWRFVNGLAEIHAGHSKTENATNSL
jgi:dimethylaniline monooxygenase (N-oxide forming)